MLKNLIKNTCKTMCQKDNATYTVKIRVPPSPIRV